MVHGVGGFLDGHSPGPDLILSHPSSRSGLAIEAGRLETRFGAKQALAGVDLAVAPGTVYGLLGPNGAGKPRVGL